MGAAASCPRPAACFFLAPPLQVSVPERVGGHEYYVEQLPGAPHPRYMRRPASAGTAAVSSAAAEVVLDVNELAAVHGEYVQVGQVRWLKGTAVCSVAGAVVAGCPACVRCPALAPA